MRDLRKWLLGVALVTTLAGAAVVIEGAASPSVVAQERAPGDQWRNFDGHWSYWHEGDKRWYYTDGTHWYYHNGLAWVLYPFDRLFGSIGFHHGEYHVPAPHIKLELPHHGVYSPR